MSGVGLLFDWGLRKTADNGPFVSMLWIYNKFLTVNSELEKHGGFKASFQQSTF